MMKTTLALLIAVGALLSSTGCRTSPTPSSFVPKFDFAGSWSDGSPYHSDARREGRRVVFTYCDSGYVHEFEGRYVDEQTIVGIQTRKKNADGTVTRMRLTIIMLSANEARIPWVALDSNSDLQAGQTGVAHIRRVFPTAPKKHIEPPMKNLPEPVFL